MEVTDNDPRSQERVVEQWIQREWIQQNDLQVHLTGNPQYNEIPEGQTLLEEGWSNCSDKGSWNLRYIEVFKSINYCMTWYG